MPTGKLSSGFGFPCRDDAAAHHHVVLVEHHRLTGSRRPLRGIETYLYPLPPRSDGCAGRCMAVADLGQDLELTLEQRVRRVFRIQRTAR